jgi:hypothetical protein
LKNSKSNPPGISEKAFVRQLQTTLSFLISQPEHIELVDPKFISAFKKMGYLNSDFNVTAKGRSFLNSKIQENPRKQIDSISSLIKKIDKELKRG